uniref:Protein kinase domain-containing protein n=1 Tax=Toxocara canis TaxID=6265 RepID=A0A183UT08_TOXCA
LAFHETMVCENPRDDVVLFEKGCDEYRGHLDHLLIAQLPLPLRLIQGTNLQTLKLLGKGGFGAVYEVRRQSDGEVFAMKCELVDVRKRVLIMDCNVLRGAQCLGSQHFCEIVDRGKQPERFRFLIMKLVGRNLWDLRVERRQQRFTLNTALKASEQCLECIEHLHKIGFLHRDIKPGNFAIGRPENNEHHTIFMLDFGLCRQFSTADKDLRLPREMAPFRGTTRYASITALRQMEQSRKDDVESWFYVTVEWTAGALPWKKLRGPDKDEVLRWKEEVREGDALDDFLKECPKREFSTILAYIDTLEYESIPDYDHIYYCIQHAAKANGIAKDEPLDWDPDHRYHGPTIDLKARRKNEEETNNKNKSDDIDHQQTAAVAMGNSNFKSNTDQHHTTLDRDVYDAVKKQYNSIGSRMDECSFEKFSTNCLEAKFQQIIYKYLSSLCKGQKNLTSLSFVRFAELVLGDYDEQAKAIIHFGQPLRTIVEGIVSSFLICEERPNHVESIPLLTDYIMESAPVEPYQQEALSRWLMHSAVFPVLWKQVFETLLLGHSKKILPPIDGRTVLTSAAQFQYKKLCKFCSRIHGESFTKMLNAVNGTGACVIVIETTSGRVFGGFANEGFVCGPSFRGDVTCFLFEDRTKIAIHNATGFNENFAYLNYMQQTLPNGLGFGGSNEHWSFFLHEEFGKGNSSANISTFEKCWLAGQSEFTVKNVEAWRIGKARKRRRYDSEGNEIIEKEISALDRDPQSAAILELSGKPMHSDGFREPPVIDDD